jgi:hypothetical protein
VGELSLRDEHALLRDVEADDPDRGRQRPRETASDEDAALIELLEHRSGYTIQEIRGAFAREVGRPTKLESEIRAAVRPVLVERSRPKVAPVDLARVLGCSPLAIKREISK